MFRLSVPLPVIGPPVRPVPLPTLVTVPPEPGAEFVIVTVPPNATDPPPDNPEPACTVIEGFANKELVTPPAGMLIVPLLVMGPPVSPEPVLTVVTVPPTVLVSVTVPPKATVPPPDNPEPACTVMEGFASMALITPAEGILIVPLAVIGPPVRPAPVLTLVTVPPPPAPGKVWPEAKLISPLLAMESPVSDGAVPFDPNSRLSVPEGLAELFPVGSAIQRKSCVTAFDVPLLNEDVCKSNGFELKPLLAVAAPVIGMTAPAAVIAPVNVPVVKEAVVPLNPPVNAPPLSCK